MLPLDKINENKCPKVTHNKNPSRQAKYCYLTRQTEDEEVGVRVVF